MRRATDAAIERAARAFETWRRSHPPIALDCCVPSPTTVDAHIEELAQLEVANAGHTISNARGEAGNVRDVLNYYAAAPERHFGKQIPVAGGVDITFKEPLGVVGVIVPWNFPMPIAGWGFAPALAAGNTVVLKPAEVTPLTAIRLGELALEAGLPPDVFTVIPGKGRWSGSDSSRIPPSANWCSPVQPLSGNASCAAQPTRSNASLLSSAARARTWCSPTPT